MSDDKKTKRAAKRYPYPRAAQCEVEGQVLEIQMLNISTSGVQFATRTRIQTKNPIKVQWRDTKFGLFDPTLLIAREIHKPENKDFQYYYGSQYYNLNAEVKQNLLVLLKNFKDEAKKEVKKQVEKITPRFLFEVIEQGSSFLRRAFDGGEIPAYFDNLIKEIKDYERLSFTNDSDVSVCIQKLTTHNFHCNLFGMLTPLMVESADMQLTFFQSIQVELQKISETENEVETASRKTMESGGKDEDKKNIQKMLNESSNRLFYTKQGLLQSVVETFITIDSDSPDFRSSFGKIKEEYERIVEFTNASFQEETQVYKRRTKKPTEYSKADAIMDIPVMSETKPRYLLWVNIFLIIMAGIGYGFYRAGVSQTKTSLKDQIGLQIDVQEFNRLGTQIDLTVGAEEWKKLPESHRDDTFNKIVIFLQKDKSARSCILFDDKGGIIKILYEDMKMIEQPVAPATGGT